jgi:hypothetical protein
VRLLSTTAILLGAVLLLSGCQAAGQPAESSTQSDSSSPGNSRPAPSAKPAPPAVFVPEGSALQNLPFFMSIITQAVAANPTVDSYDVAVLESQNGFEAGAIQYTFSRTAVGLASDSSTVAVLFAGECIIAQYGPVITGVQGVVLPALAQGGCLIGAQVQGL